MKKIFFALLTIGLMVSCSGPALKKDTFKVVSVKEVTGGSARYKVETTGNFTNVDGKLFFYTDKLYSVGDVLTITKSE